MAWKGGKSVKRRSVDLVEVEEMIRVERESPMERRRVPVSPGTFSPGSITKESISTDLTQQLDDVEGLAVRANNPLFEEGSIPEQALSKKLQLDIRSAEGLAARGNNPVQMAGSIPADAADLTDDWSFKRLGLHVGTTISSSGSVSVGAGTFYLVATAGGHVTVGLPAAATCTNMVLSFKKLTAANNMILDPNSSETIDGATTKTFSDQYSWVTIISNGTNWFIISQGNP
jgi:hypothetical protein